MPLRTRIFILVSVIVLLILGITIILVRRNQNKNNGDKTPTTTINTLNDTSSFDVIDANNFDPSKISGGNPSTPSVPNKTFTQGEATQNSVKQLAKIFAERYGSYSTDNNGQNVKEVKELVTPELWEKIKPNTGVKAVSFVGVSTQAIAVEINKWSESEALMKVKTIRTQEKNGKSSTLQQVGAVTLVKQGTNWLVSNFVWE